MVDVKQWRTLGEIEACNLWRLVASNEIPICLLAVTRELRFHVQQTTRSEYILTYSISNSSRC